MRTKQKIPSVLFDLTQMKTCFKCGVTKSLDEFYKHPAMGDGYLGKCKECARQDVIANRTKRVKYYRAYDKMRFHNNTARRKRLFEQTPEYRRRNPEKYRAHSLVASALRCKRLFKQPCARCGSLEVHGHHEDYSKPLDVMWLCPVHHSERHKEIEAERQAVAA